MSPCLYFITIHLCLGPMSSQEGLIHTLGSLDDGVLDVCVSQSIPLMGLEGFHLELVLSYLFFHQPSS